MVIKEKQRVNVDPISKNRHQIAERKNNSPVPLLTLKGKGWAFFFN
jgi:hypothetical protein